MPLSAAPGYGEIYGIGAGLSVWFGLPSLRQALTSTEPTAAKVHAFKHSLALIVALRAPTTYLVRDHTALNTKVNTYAQLLADAGVIDVAFAQAVDKAPLLFVPLRTQHVEVTRYPERVKHRNNTTGFTRDCIARRRGAIRRSRASNMAVLLWTPRPSMRLRIRSMSSLPTIDLVLGADDAVAVDDEDPGHVGRRPDLVAEAERRATWLSGGSAMSPESIGASVTTW